MVSVKDHHACMSVRSRSTNIHQNYCNQLGLECYTAILHPTKILVCPMGQNLAVLTSASLPQLCPAELGLH